MRISRLNMHSDGNVSLHKLLEKAVSLYNKYRKPEAQARIIGMDGDTVKIMFSGSFTETCGLVDWIEDLKYVLEDLGVRTEITEIIEPENVPDKLYKRVGVFRLLGLERPKTRG